MKKDATYVLNLDGSQIYKETAVHFFDMTEEQKKNKELYSVTIAFNLDIHYLQQNHTEEFITKTVNKKKKQFSDAIINVAFNKRAKFKKGKEKFEVSTTTIRETLYVNGFFVDNERYVLYKRSTSKSREGSTLFIKESLFAEMIRFSHMGIEFKENEIMGEKLASLKAYESLTLSGLEDLIEIKPNQILLIDTIKGEFTAKASVTTFADGEIKLEDKETEFINDIFDGQALLDRTIFKKVDRSDNGMMLLRNKFFKACAFNTNISDFLHNRKPKDVLAQDFKLKNMFGEDVLASDVKLIITPSCLKLFKFADKFENENAMWMHWLNNMYPYFGIVKSEYSSHFEDMNQLSYQHINSMQLSQQDVGSLMDYETGYVNRLKNDIEVFKKHIETNDESDTRQFMLELVNRNAEIENTEFFKEFREDVVQSYISRLKRGKIKIKNTDYMVLCCNPYEMLLHAVGKFNKQTLHKGKEIYCSAYDDGEELIAFRNPHVASGNVLLCKNVYFKEFKRYFNFSPNITIVNSYDNDLPDRLQGCDYDSDTFLLSNNPILLKQAKKCAKYLTPVNRIELKGTAESNNRKYCNKDMAFIDTAIQNNKIGEIINLSQILNSYMFDELNKKSPYKDKVKFIYSKVSILSSLSQVEIDKPKKYYDKNIFPIDGILNRIRTSKFEEVPIIPRRKVENKNKMIKPMFFCKISDNKDDLNEYLNCAMDFLFKYCTELERKKNTKTTDIMNFIDIPADYDSKTRNQDQINKVKNVVESLDRGIDYIRKNVKQKREINKRINELKDARINCLRMKMNKSTVINVLLRLFSDKSKDDSLKSYKMSLLGLLYQTNSEVLLSCFHEKKV